MEDCGFNRLTEQSDDVAIARLMKYLRAIPYHAVDHDGGALFVSVADDVSSVAPVVCLHSYSLTIHLA
jgi:hypothetical protein